MSVRTRGKKKSVLMVRVCLPALHRVVYKRSPRSAAPEKSIYNCALNVRPLPGVGRCRGALRRSSGMTVYCGGVAAIYRTPLTGAFFRKRRKSGCSASQPGPMAARSFPSDPSMTDPRFGSSPWQSGARGRRGSGTGRRAARWIAFGGSWRSTGCLTPPGPHRLRPRAPRRRARAGAGDSHRRVEGRPWGHRGRPPCAGPRARVPGRACLYARLLPLLGRSALEVMTADGRRRTAACPRHPAVGKPKDIPCGRFSTRRSFSLPSYPSPTLPPPIPSCSLSHAPTLIRPHAPALPGASVRRVLRLAEEPSEKGRALGAVTVHSYL